MPKSLVLGNGSILVCFDSRAQVRDFYFPYAGLENHAGGGCVHKIGVFADGTLNWLEDPGWDISMNYQNETLVSDLTAHHKQRKVELRFADAVYNEKNILVRRVKITNHADAKRTIKVFFHQQFQIRESNRGNTAYYDPYEQAVVHYKGRRIFLVAGRAGDKSFDDYSTGLFRMEGKEGTWRDAEDGVLSQNPIEHGSVDSAIGFTLSLQPGKSKEIFYWIAAAKTRKELKALHHYVTSKSPRHLLETTKDFWHAWVNERNFSFQGLDKKVAHLFKKSLCIIRTHIDNNGAIIASGDSDMLQYGRDTYSYVWPRDGAFVAAALDRAGYADVTRRFFEFCNEVVSDQGYLFHKYQCDRAIGSSWHPWIQGGKKQLAIQEDETALVLWALWGHYQIHRDLEFIETIYNSFIKKTAEFMFRYRDPVTKLPLPSYDLWEEKWGTCTFTAAAVYAALEAARQFAGLLGKEEEEEKYRKAAQETKEAILRYLYDTKQGFFYKLVNRKEGKMVYDATFDTSSFYGVFRFGVLDVHDSNLAGAAKIVQEKLCCKTNIGGSARYAGDAYYQVSPETPGNPWFITTLWFTQYFIARAQKIEDLQEAKEQLEWVVERALPSGILSEQVNPFTGEQISAAPLSWSHSEFITTVIQYTQKFEELKAVKYSKTKTWLPKKK